MLTLRPFSPTDPTRIRPRADFHAEHVAAGEPLFGPMRPEGLCWTLAADPSRWAPPLACGGLEPLGHGRWSGWIFAADLSPRGWAMVQRAFRGLVVESGARRVEIAVRSPDGADGWDLTLRAMRFAERLGLTREGVMRGWGPDGRDYYLFGGLF